MPKSKVKKEKIKILAWISVWQNGEWSVDNKKIENWYKKPKFQDRCEIIYYA